LKRGGSLHPLFFLVLVLKDLELRLFVTSDSKGFTTRDFEVSVTRSRLREQRTAHEGCWHISQRSQRNRQGEVSEVDHGKQNVGR
jgi:hypothetical protein